MAGQNTRNPKPESEKPEPNPKNPNPKNPNPNSGSNPRYPKLLRVVRVLATVPELPELPEISPAHRCVYLLYEISPAHESLNPNLRTAVSAPPHPGTPSPPQRSHAATTRAPVASRPPAPIAPVTADLGATPKPAPTDRRRRCPRPRPSQRAAAAPHLPRRHQHPEPGGAAIRCKRAGGKGLL